MLAELAEIGMDLARALHRQVVLAPAECAPPEAIRVGDAGLVFARIARAVRQTVALEARIDADAESASRRREVEDAAGREAEAARLAAAGRVRAERRRGEVRRIVERVIASDCGARDADVLRADLDERLEDGDDGEDGDFLEAPIGELVARICGDLQLSPDWTEWAAAPWVADAVAATPGRPAAPPVAVAPIIGPGREAQGRDPPWGGFSLAR